MQRNSFYKKIDENFIFSKIPTAGMNGSPLIKKEGGRHYLVGIHIGRCQDTSFGLLMAKRVQDMLIELVEEESGKLDLGK